MFERTLLCLYVCLLSILLGRRLNRSDWLQTFDHMGYWLADDHITFWMKQGTGQRYGGPPIRFGGAVLSSLEIPTPLKVYIDQVLYRGIGRWNKQWTVYPRSTFSRAFTNFRYQTLMTSLRRKRWRFGCSVATIQIFPKSTSFSRHC